MRIRIDLGYDGSAFSGWARQPGLRTVQGELERVLHMVLRVPLADHDRALRLTVAGRTDAGVHARHQVCHCDVEPGILNACIGHLGVDGAHALQYRLRHALPEDISVLSVGVAPDGFDARFSALQRTYVYRICDEPGFMDPRLRSFVLGIDERLDIDRMNAAAERMTGLHDFGSFATPNPNGTTIREVKHAYWSRMAGDQIFISKPPACPDDDRAGMCTRPGTVEPLGSGLILFTIVADAFAHNMVRSLVNACVQVGRHRRTVAWFVDKLEHPLREGDTGPIAAKGLSLEQIAYPDDDELASRAERIRAKRTL